MWPSALCGVHYKSTTWTPQKRWENSDIETRDSTCHSYKGTRQYKYYETRQCHMRQYIGINQTAMASTLETTIGEPGVMMSHINQDSLSHQATISYHTLGLSNCCSIQTKPPFDLVIRLT